MSAVSSAPSTPRGRQPAMALPRTLCGSVKCMPARSGSCAASITPVWRNVGVTWMVNPMGAASVAKRGSAMRSSMSVTASSPSMLPPLWERMRAASNVSPSMAQRLTRRLVSPGASITPIPAASSAERPV